ncbi:MAG: hypothetical protein FWD69_19300 [Polyangiaceae bacterium]|nr:hypothetical protein [Polyangiaceae bacterium]
MTRRNTEGRLLRISVASGLAVGACLVLHPAVARAQATIAINPTYVNSSTGLPSLPRLGSDGKPVTKRGLNFNPEGVSLQDCVDDQSIQFPLTLSNFVANAPLQVWASLGDDCTTQTARSGGVQTCWQLVSGIPLSTNPSVNISVRAIMSGVLSATSTDASESICGTIPRSTVAVNFLYFDPGNIATASANVAVNVAVNTIGPDAPTGLTHLPGNQRIHVYWDAIGEGGVNAITGVKVYCDPTQANPGDADADVDADVDADDADADAASTSTGDCFSPNFVSANGGSIQPDNAFDSQFLCGSITGNTGSQVIASEVGGHPLENGVSYAVALAATDDFQNVGPLSEVQCETPQPTTDFWENYKDAGGGAGGVYCTVDGVGLPMGGVSVLGVAGMFAFYMIRRVSSRTRNDR